MFPRLKSLSVALFLAPSIFCIAAMHVNAEEAPLDNEAQGDCNAETALKGLGATIKRNDDGEVLSVRVNGPQFGDDQVVHLEKLRWSKRASTGLGPYGPAVYPLLALANTRITNDGFAQIPGLTQFRTLVFFGNTDIADGALKHLRRLPRLQSLYFEGNRFTGDGLVHLKGLKELRVLLLGYEKGITDDGMKHLSELGLKRLDLSGTQITEAGLEHLKSMKTIEQLKLQDLQVTDAGLKNLLSMKNLRNLNLRRTAISDVGLEYLKSLKSLVRLRVSGNQISDAGLEHLENLVNLTHLELSENHDISSDGLVHLKNLLPNLKQLRLAFTGINDDALVHVKGLVNLQELDLRGTEVSQEGVDKVRKALPNCEVAYP